MAGRKSVLDRYPVCQQYLMTRAKAFSYPANEIKETLPDDFQVYGAVIDMPMGGNVLSTMVCYANGSVNLYYNNGGAVIGVARKYRTAAQATRTMVLSSEKCLPVCQRVTQHDLPTGRDCFVYLLTRKGVFKTVITPEDLKGNNDMKKNLYYTYQNIMSEIRDAQLREEKERSQNTTK